MEVDKNSGVDRNSVKLVDESSVVVQNTGLKLEGLDEKAMVDQRVFSPLYNSVLPPMNQCRKVFICNGF